MSRAPVAIRVHRERGRTCSVCHAGLAVGVKASLAKSKLDIHFLFCRVCATEIGSVATGIGRRPTKARGE